LNSTWIAKVTRMLALAVYFGALAAIANKAHAQEDYQEFLNRRACMADAMMFCVQFVPDRERVAVCLLANRHRVSAQCRAALARWHG